MDKEERNARAAIEEAARAHGLDIFGGSVRRSSSRFCLSVEHGDYNGTELFGVGTDRFIWLAYKRNGTRKNRLYSVNFPGEGVLEFECGHAPQPHAGTEGSWSQFAHGCDWVLAREKFPLSEGIDAVLYGNIPGGGMSRSASLTLNLILTMLEVNGHKDVEMMKVVDMSQAVENAYVGSPCGNLDQVMILFARAGHGTHYDPKTRSVKHVPFGSDRQFRLLVLDTGTTRQGLDKSTYSIRAAECKQFIEIAGEKLGLKKLADIKTPEQMARVEAEYGKAHPNLVARARYIYEAQARFYRMLDAWKRGDIVEVGSLFRADGIGLRDTYSISGPELEAMCDIVRTVPGVLGERMLGGGDKGASGLLCTPEAVDWVRAAVATSYPRGHPEYANKWAVHECRFVDGIKVLPGF
eukprot:m51a1_g467 putative galactokinase (409) ;mRNA; f:179954-181307